MVHRFLHWFPILVLVGFAGFSILYWLDLNVVPYGRDAGGHLATSLAYRPLLESPSAKTLFEVLLVNGYRPPILYLSTLPFYALFGANFDSAGYANVVWLVLTVLGCYALGRHIAGHWVGVLGATFYLMFPFVHGVARLFYFETGLAAFVVWNMVALLKSNQWTHRGWSIVWGVTLGLGMLTKWTLPATVGLPILYVMWQASKERGTWDKVTLSVWNTGHFVLSMGIGVVGSILFLLPNHQSLSSTVAGFWLYPLFAITWGLTLFIATRLPGRWINLATGVFVALSVMAIWYYLQPGFVLNFVDAAYLTAEGRDEPLDLSNPRTYVYYLHYLFTQLLGPFMALIILPLVLFPLWSVVRRPYRTEELDKDGIVLLWLGIIGTYGAFTVASYNSERSMLVLLVPLAVLAGVSLSFLLKGLVLNRYGKWVGRVVFVLVLGVGLVQWAVITLPSFATLWESAPLWVAKGEFLQHPTAGATDPRYWIAPDVLARITPTDGEPTSFGMLVNSEGIHRGPYRYLIAANDFSVELMPLTERDNTWGDVFENEWILVKNGVNSDVESGGLFSIDQILGGNSYFDLLYEKIAEYPLPGNETAMLYYRDTGPAFPATVPEWQQTTLPIAQAINAGWSETAQLLLPDADVATWLATETITATHVAWIEGIPPDPTASPLFVVVTPNQDPRPVFDQVFYPASTLQTERATLVIYGQPQSPLEVIPVQAEWETFALTSLQSWQNVTKGDVLPIEVTIAGEIPTNHNISLRLLNDSGEVVGQVDRPLTEKIRAGIQVRPNLPPAQYEVVLLVYDVTTFAPLRTLTETEDTLLFTIEVQ
jgi:4-amino-4-deoxy-L-arabinose transferase-like glycosyltransferase